MPRPSINSLKHSLNFEKLEIYADKSEIHESSTYLRSNASWILPQLLAFVGNTLPLARNSRGLFSFKESFLALKSSLDSDQIIWEGLPVTKLQMKAVFNIFCHHPRGHILGSLRQNNNGSRYSSGVPLFLSAFKEYRNINYENWDWMEVEKRYFVDPTIVELSEHFHNPPDISKEELLEIREYLGSKGKELISIVVASAPDFEEFNKLSRQLKLLLTQVWIYHPSIGNKYLIANLMDLDAPAEPLVSTDVVMETDDHWGIITPNPKPKSKTKPKPEVDDFPWDV